VTKKKSSILKVSSKIFGKAFFQLRLFKPAFFHEETTKEQAQFYSRQYVLKSGNPHRTRFLTIASCGKSADEHSAKQKPERKHNGDM
jgi:hypothetical protein